jgi:hypothetical protein
MIASASHLPADGGTGRPSPINTLLKETAFLRDSMAIMVNAKFYLIVDLGKILRSNLVNPRLGNHLPTASIETATRRKV